MKKHRTNFFTHKRLLDLFFLGLILSPPLLILWTIHRYGVNIPFWDEWDFLPRLDKFYNGALTLSDIWLPLNEHRSPVYLLMDYGLGWLTHYNRLGNLYMGFIFRLTALWTTWKLLNFSLRDKQPQSIRYLMLALSILLFTPVEFENWIFPQTSLVWNFQVLCAVLTVWFLVRYSSSWAGILSALGVVLISSLTNGTGLPLWLVGFTAIIVNRFTKEQRKGWLLELFWSTVFILFLGIYYHNFPANSQFSQRLIYVFKHLSECILFVLSFLGGFFSENTVICSIISLAGLFSNGVAAYIFLKRQPRLFSDALPWILLSLYSIINAAIITFGRVQLGVQAAGASRYLSISSLFWIGTTATVFLACQKIFSTGDVLSTLSKQQTYLTAVRVVALLCFILFAYSYSLSVYAAYERAILPWHNTLSKGYDQVLKYRRFPQLVTNVIHPNPATVLQGARILDRWDLGPFATHSSQTAFSEFIPPAKPGVYDDRSRYLMYQGTWVFQADSHMYKETYSYSKTIGDLAEFRFKGVSVNLRYPTQPGQGYGVMDIYLDNKLVATLDMNSDDFDATVTWKSQLLEPGEHTLKMVHRTGQFVGLDAIIVR